MRVQVLGPTTVVDDSGCAIDLGPRRHVEVVALLAAFAGERVNADVLADMLWRGAPPASSATTLQGYIARLRKILEPQRSARAASNVIATVGTGYRLEVDTDATDFVADLHAAQRDAEVSPAAAARRLTAALDQWTGPALADVADVDAVVAEANRLDELRLTAEETRARLLLSTGDTADLAARLRRLAAAHPLRERLCGLLARALYQGGRQAEALAVLRDVQARLAAELGVDPGPEIVALHQQILQHDTSLAAAPSATPTAEIIGRAAERATLRRAWADAQRGAVVTVVVRGEPGIGKTTLAADLATDVAAAGGTVRWGRCAPDPGAPPYWPWVAILRTRAQEQHASAEAGRYVFALDAAAHLESLAGTGALIVLDDLQWADADSLVVLEAVLAQLDPTSAVLILLTLRPDPARTDPIVGRLLAALARRRGHIDLELSGLAADEVADLVGAAPAIGADLVRRTGGNPFFVRALAGTSHDHLPHTVRDVVAERAAALPSGGSTVLAALALSARPLARPLLAAAAGQTDDAVDSVLDVAVRTGLLTEPAPDQFAIAHDIVRESIVAGLRPGEAARIHGRLGEVLADVGTPAAVAEHLFAAGAGHTAAQAGLRAARLAADVAAFADAIGWAQRALAVTDDHELRCDAMIVAGTAARRTGQLSEASRWLEAAADEAHAVGDVGRMGAIALASVPGGVGGYWALFGVPTVGSGALLEETIGLLDRFDSPTQARLLAAQSTQLTASGSPGAEELARRALQVAGADRDARARSLVALVLALWSPATADEQSALLDELTVVSRGDHALAATAMHLQRCVHLMMGRPIESARAARRFADLAGRSRDPDLAQLELWWTGGMQLLRGEVDAARATAERAESAAAHRDGVSHSLDRGSRATIDGIAAWYEGRLIDVVGDALDLAVDFHPDFLLVSALGHAEAGHRARALAAIDRLQAMPVTGPLLVPRTVMISEALVALRDSERLADLLPDLRALADRIVVLWPGDTCLGPGSLYYGAALAVLGEHDRARTELITAIADAEAIGARPFVNRARRRLAEFDLQA